MASDLRRLFGRIGILSTPLVVVLILYIVLDPFRVLYTYPNYYDDYVLVQNRDYISTELYLRHPDRAKIDSFVFGSSRSLAFRADDWRSFIGARYAYHFDGFGESLFGIYTKIRFLKREGRVIRHALLVVDWDVLSRTTNSPGHLFIKDPRVSGESRWAFHGEFVKAFAFPSFLVSYLSYRIRGEPLLVSISEDTPGAATKDTNDLGWPDFDAQIQKDPEAFYARLLPKMPKREDVPTPTTPVIGEEQERMLKEIRRIFDGDHTDARVIISPMWIQKPLHPSDVAKLRRIFGSENVFDYSGPNPISSDIHNFYDVSHFRASVGHAILLDVYGQPGGQSR